MQSTKWAIAEADDLAADMVAGQTFVLYQTSSSSWSLVVLVVGMNAAHEVPDGRSVVPALWAYTDIFATTLLLFSRSRHL